MTHHRFIRCSPTAVLNVAYLGHNLSDGRNFDTINTGVAQPILSAETRCTGMTTSRCSAKSDVAFPWTAAQTAQLRI